MIQGYGDLSNRGHIGVVCRENDFYIVRTIQGKKVFGPNDEKLESRETVLSFPIEDTWDFRNGFYPFCLEEKHIQQRNKQYNLFKQ